MADSGDAITPGIDHNRLAAARLRAADTQPFLALALYALTPVSRPGLGTFAVDAKWRLFVDPHILASWEVEEVAGVLLHEVGHMVRDHCGRAKDARVNEETARPWNLAADAEINDDLRSDLVRLPDNPVFPETLGLPRGRAAEFYFYEIIDRDLRDLASPDCGSGCHGLDEAAVEVAPLPADVPGLDEAEALLLRHRVAEVIVQIAGVAAGSVPGGWRRWAEALLRPQIDWRLVLASAVRAGVASVSGAVDYSYQRPARRRLPRVILPALQRPLPRVAIIVDTSGSIDDESLNTAWTEVHACLRGVGVRRDLLSVYATDTHARKLRHIEARTLEVIGGGGTDMAAGIERAMTSRPRPHLVVVLTDGFTPWPDRPPRAKVIIGMLELPEEFATSFEPPPTPSWATTVPIRVDRADSRSPR